ncbi:MAG TPA: hypothetical protein EYN70_02530 [Planctomycetaceae bacterium]|nr:hypothetical protein [Planctomycetaceae bacterium]
MNQDQSLADRCVQRHIRFGWWSLLTFVALGILLESLLAYKVTWYLGEDYENVRRLMWRLAHAHGTLLSLVHLLFAMTVHLVPATISQRGARFASPCFMAASFLLPGGFFLGGIFTFEQHADPGIGIFLVPVGALMMVVAVLLTALGVTKASGSEGSEGS